MARKTREKSVSGIYHVMLRGINKQDILLCEDDFHLMLSCMKEAQINRSDDGKVLNRDNCVYYAYCLLHNHVHILLGEKNLSVSELMKRLQNRFVRIYNENYERVGHLFQDRFLSEPVDDPEYFYQLIRYIHRNPVKAMEAKCPEDYRYSSWREYLKSMGVESMGSDPNDSSLCNTSAVIRRYGAAELQEWVNQDIDDNCMDMDKLVGEEQAWTMLREICGLESVEDFKQLPATEQLDCLRRLVDRGASIKQAARLSSLSYTTIWRKLK